MVVSSPSSSSPLMFGVPQGLVLGPVLFVLYTTPLSNIVTNHLVNHQLHKSTPPNDVHSLTVTHDLQSCTDDIKARMCSNQLKHNEDKTEAILFSTHFLSSSLLTIIGHRWYTQNCVFRQSGFWGLSLTLTSH